MGVTNLPAVAALAAVYLLVYKYFIYPAFLSPLAKIPAANFTTRFNSLWLHYIRYTDQENKTTYELHKQKGPIIRIAPNELSVNCYEGGLRIIYQGGFEKNEWYSRRFTMFETDPMFAMKDNKSHSTRKRMFSHLYSKSNILSDLSMREATKTALVDRLLPLIERSARNNLPLDMCSLSYGFFMDAFTLFQFGHLLGTNFIQNEADRKWYLDQFTHPRGWAYWSDYHPKLIAWLRKVGIWLIPQSSDQALEALGNWHLDICDRAEALVKQDSALSIGDRPISFAHHYAVMNKLSNADTGFLSQAYPNRLEIASEMFDHDAAAHETSGILVTYLLYELSLRPTLQAALRKELITLSPSMAYDPVNKLTQLPDPKAVDALPLLDAILQESLRLWSPTPGHQPRLTPAGGCSLAGYDNIPGGVCVHAASYSLHRNEGVFPEPEVWKPERWLNATPKELTEMKRWFWAWGSGGRMCVGQHIATSHMKNMVAGLYSNFTSTVVGEPDMVQSEGFIGRPRGNQLMLQWTRV